MKKVPLAKTLIKTMSFINNSITKHKTIHGSSLTIFCMLYVCLFVAKCATLINMSVVLIMMSRFFARDIRENSVVFVNLLDE